MQCPVCDNVNTSMVCPNCGFDSSRDYGKYPTFGSLGGMPSVSALREQWQVKQKPVEQPAVQPELSIPHRKKSKLLPLVIAAAFALTLGLGVWIGAGFGGEKPERWRENVLRSDALPLDGSVRPDIYQSCVLGSDYHRNWISSVIFLDTLADAPQEAWDVSVAGDGSVLAWTERDGWLYFRLYIGAEGGVSAGTSCRHLFAGYYNLEEINFGDNFHTDAVQDMSYMFYGCESLKRLDLSGFDMSNVKNKNSMFLECPAIVTYD